MFLIMKVEDLPLIKFHCATEECLCIRVVKKQEIVIVKKMIYFLGFVEKELTLEGI